jgi:hypothetical protein
MCYNEDILSPHITPKLMSLRKLDLVINSILDNNLDKSSSCLISILCHTFLIFIKFKLFCLFGTDLNFKNFK